MEYFNSADWFVISAYLLGIIGLGIWFGKDQQNTRDYFLGSRNIPWWGIGLSIVAAETSALTIISVPAMAFGTNMAFIQIVLGYLIARLILAIVMVPHYFKGEIYSPYQLLEESFGPSARKLAGGFFLISETLAAGVRVYVASIPVKLMLGEKLLSLGTGDPLLGAILLFIVLSLVYTYIGGVKAVIWTDAVQFLLFMAGGLFTLFYIPSLLPGGVGEAFQRAAEAGKFKWFDPHFSLSLPFNIWMGLIGATFVTLSSHGAEQLIVQRVLACKNVSDGRRALVLSAIVILPLFLVFLGVGCMLWVYYQSHPIPLKLPTNDHIYPVFMMTSVPHVLKGFLIVAILSAAMSSVSSALTSLASVSTMDFLKEMTRGSWSDAAYLRFSKYSTIIWAGALIIVAYLSRQAAYVLNAAFALRGLTSGALLGSLILVLLWRRGTALPLYVGMIGSFLLMIVLSQLEWSVPGVDLRAKLAWPWYTLIGTLVTIVLAALTRAVLRAHSPAAAPVEAE